MNPYKILEISQNATASEIKKAFLLKAKRLHPDSPLGSDEKFKELMEAYNKVKNLKKESYFEHNININYSDILKRYERPSNKQQKREKSENYQTGVGSDSGGFGYNGFIIASLFISLWGIGIFQDLTIAKNVEADYKKNNEKLYFDLYEDALLKKKSIKF